VSTGPSVLIITLDTTRADRLGPYGYALATTPAYDAFALTGTTFVRAYSSCPLTIPSHSTIFTGRYPPSHGVRDNGDFVLGPDAVTLAERFSEAGYATAAFTSAFPTQARWGFDQGFDVYHDPLDRLPDQLDWRDQRTADEVIDDALAVYPNLEGPVFSWVHLFDAHWPYEPPEPWASRHPDRPYDGEIAFTDSQVDRLLTWWDAHHPDSIIVITADHGEGLGDGGEQTHGFLLHDGTMRVPLMIRYPEGEPGARVNDPVGTVDIAPTVLALAGIELHEGIQGRDLREGGSTEVYSEALTGQFNLGLSPLYAYTDGSGRYMEGSWGGWYPADGDAVDVEPVDLRDNEAEGVRLGTMRAALDEVVAPTAALDDDALEQLMALGYIGGDPTAAAGEIDPRDVIDVIPLTWRVRQMIGSGRLGVASQALARLEERMPNTFGVQLLSAQLLRRQGRNELAIGKLADLYLTAPSSTLALQLAALHVALGAWVDAELWYREALDFQSNSPDAMAGIVRALQAQGYLEAAQEHANEYLLIYPDHAQLVLIRAEMHLVDGRPDLAYGDAWFALGRLPTSPWAHTVTAQALWDLGEADDAIDLLQSALRLDPMNASVRVRLTECMLEVGRNAESVRTVAPLARLYPEDEIVAELHQRAVAALAVERGEAP
jgi:arylsulfatase A-like enzyme/Flp pilus assembly protein TadD